jgi:dimethylaniline monooxygenase (N-oxide forming)
MTSLPRACIIGAGSSGITAVKALHDRGVPFDCYEKSDCIGGNWVLGNKNAMSAAYRTLHISSSRTSMAYADLPMPESLPFFPHHTHIAAYFNDYVDRFGLSPRHNRSGWPTTSGDHTHCLRRRRRGRP